VLLTCSDSTVKHNTTWLKDGQMIVLWGKESHLYKTEQIFPYGALLRVLNAQQSADFTCEASNSAGR
jgi:hypothetical protein